MTPLEFLPGESKSSNESTTSLNMNKLFKSKQAASNRKDSLVKKSITTQLSNSVKAIQYCGIEENSLNKTDDITEAYHTLCTTMEAIFLHGLKDSLSRRFKRAIADVDERPEPSFWEPLLVISHRQIINQVLLLSQITTEVGQCRAWIRLALNDCILSSYIMVIRRDPEALKSFYHPSAFVRDSELLDVAQTLIEGVESLKNFTLPCNSSLLNTWQLPSLYLAGIWTPTLKVCPLAPCDDVAQMVQESNIRRESNSETCSLNSTASIISENSALRQVVALNEDEALKIILAKREGNSEEVLEATAIQTQGPCTGFDVVNYNLGNSLNLKSGWSFDKSQQPDDDEISPSVEENVKKVEPKSMEGSFNALIESYNLLSKSDTKREVWKETTEHKSKNNSDKNSNNEVLPKMNTDSDNISLTKTSAFLSEQIGKISKEKGFDRQNYECAGCKQPLSLTPLKVCGFTSEYFCEFCMCGEKIPIPARIIHNWDFNPYPVSQKAFNYIDKIKDDPIINFKVLNPSIYGVIEQMEELRILRSQLNFLRAYLYTCKEPIIEELHKQIRSREYMYEHVHQYSISDLFEISNGSLSRHLQAVVDFGKKHVAGCWLCSQKGFVCEVCNKPKALFPFDVELIYHCDVCNAVYHKECLNSTKPCPKCKRRKDRRDLPLLGATAE